MSDLENIYDEQISPLMQQIIEICKDHKMPMFASFEFNDGDFYNTRMRFDGHPVFDYYDAIYQSTENGGINIDKFMFWVMRGARKIGHSSIVLNQLNIPEQPTTDNTEGE